jgi:hypothetical protein
LTARTRKKPSTIRGYEQIWRQHLKSHFGNITLQEYEAHMGTQFLQSLTGSQGKATLKHIKALGGSIFKRAVIERRIKVSPWHDVAMPDDAIEPERTRHYTREEAENIISVPVDRVDRQLTMALACFLGLRPNEIAHYFGKISMRNGCISGVVTCAESWMCRKPESQWKS